MAPFEFAVGRERCRERFVRVRRPMFDRVFLRGDCVVALPRRGTKTASAVAFELGSGREVDIATLPREGAGSGDGVRLDYLSSPVGRGPSQLRLFAGSSSEPWRTLELPDAISAVAEAPFGWYVGCRDGFLYALDRAGDLLWRWQTPGASAFRSAGPSEVYFRPSPYRLASNGHSALVSWFGSLWSVGADGVTEWGLRLQDLSDRHVTEVRLRGRQSAAAAALGVPGQASPLAIKRAYREAVKQAHPDLHPDDPSAAERFRSVQQAYESLTGHGPVTGNGRGVIRFSFPSAAAVSFLDVVEDDWLVGGGGGTLFRLSSQGRLVARVRIGIGALFGLRDCSQQVVAVCSYPVAGRSQPNLWFVDAPAPVRLPEQYPWPDHLLGSYGDYLLVHRPRGRDLGLIYESGALAVQLRCPRPITSLCVAEGALLLAAGALICLEIDGLSPLQRTRVWRPPFTAGFHEPNVSGAPQAA
jgi:DnaJ domain